MTAPCVVCSSLPRRTSRDVALAEESPVSPSERAEVRAAADSPFGGAGEGERGARSPAVLGNRGTVGIGPETPGRDDVSAIAPSDYLPAPPPPPPPTISTPVHAVASGRKLTRRARVWPRELQPLLRVAAQLSSTGRDPQPYIRGLRRDLTSTHPTLGELLVTTLSIPWAVTGSYASDSPLSHVHSCAN